MLRLSGTLAGEASHPRLRVMRVHTRSGGSIARTSSASGAEPPVPVVERALQGWITFDVALQRGAFGGIEHAERVFSAAQIVVARIAGLGWRVHCSRQVFSCMRLRRIQLFIVPSGTARHCASSL